jgi:hypothetical protein
MHNDGATAAPTRNVMSRLSLIPEITDRNVRLRAVKRLRELNVTLPTLSELADPGQIS